VLFEGLAFGRQPLAISERCYHARLHKLAKDNCRFVCENDPDGLAVDTLDGERFLAINGVQTLSFTCANLVADIPALSAAGLRALRLSPQVCDMAAVARVFRDVLDGRREAGSGLEALGAIYPKATFANGFLHGEAGARRIGAPGLRCEPACGVCRST
jgi:collagenase-like PrtC family protease